MKNRGYILPLVFGVIFGSFSFISSKKNINSTIPQSKLVLPTTEEPLLIWSSDSEPIDDNRKVAIFYTPHQDDETIGMGASISEHVRSNRPVYIVLLSNGRNPSTTALLNGSMKCNYHNTFHNFKVTEQDVIKARNNEFLAACKALGVTRVYIANGGNGYEESIGLNNMTDKFKNTINYFNTLYPNASHKTISGNCDPYNEKGGRKDTHMACANAMKQLYQSGEISDIRLYRVYTFYFPLKQRNANWKKQVNRIDLQKRQKACDEYNVFNPAIGRFAIGYQHSVWQLFRNSYDSEYEYIDFDPTQCL